MAEGLSGTATVLQVSFDGGTNKKNLVCMRSNTFGLTNNVITEKTSCGTLKALDTPDYGWDFDGLVRIDAGAGMVTYKELSDAAANGTTIKLYDISPAEGANLAGALWYYESDVLVSSISKETPMGGGFVSFSGRFDGTGELVTSA